jgi:dienelactone hydrolase
MNMLSKISLITLIFLGMNSWAQATDVSREQDYAADLAATPTFGEILRLGEGGDQFLAIYAQTEQVRNRGTVILLHDMGSHPDKDPVIYHLRRQLPEYNWATLALQMPVREAGAATTDYYSLFQEAQVRVLEAVRYLALKGTGTIIILGHGVGGQMAIYTQASAPMHEIKALVTISLNVPDTAMANAQILKFISQLTTPLFDIYSIWDSSEVISRARDKRIAARNNSNYRQFKLEQHIPYASNPEPLVKRIDSWLTRVTYPR